MSKGLEKRKLASDVLDYLDDDSVSVSKDNEVKKVPVDQLVPFHNHPFKLYEGQRLDDMVESIREHGIHLPGRMLVYRIQGRGDGGKSCVLLQRSAFGCIGVSGKFCTTGKEDAV